jgi:hypothetical protein
MFVASKYGADGADDYAAMVVQQLQRTECYPMRSDMKVVASYDMPSVLLNRIHNLTVQTFDSNLLSVESDCPARERLGYGDDVRVRRCHSPTCSVFAGMCAVGIKSQSMWH